MADLPRVLMITSEWPTSEKPYQVPFIVRQATFLKRAGVALDVYPFRGSKRPDRYAAFWAEAQRKIASRKYDLVHAQWGQSALLALPKRIPLVVTFRGDDLEGIIGSNGKPTLAGYALQNLSRVVSRVADEVILVSESLARRMPKRDYHIIPSGIDMDLFRPIAKQEARKKLGLSPNQRLVLFAGSATNPRKRIDLARTVVELVCQEMDAELLVASGVNHDQIPLYMNASDALLLTSLHEGSPNVVKEAMACNLPIVSTNVGDVQERIGNIQGCFISQEDDPETIAKGLLKILKVPERPDLRSHVMDLDENILTQKVIQVYRKTINYS